MSKEFDCLTEAVTQSSRAIKKKQRTSKMNHLKNKFFLEDCGEHFRTGQILEASDEYVYLKYDVLRKTDCPVNQATVVMIADIASAKMDDEGEIPAWSLFDSRNELDLYLNWLNEPSKKEEEPVVVPIRGH